MNNILLASVSMYKAIRLYNKDILDLFRKSNCNLVQNPYYGKQLTEEQIINMVSNVEAIIVDSDPISRRVIEQAKKLKIIAKNGVGLDQIALETATEHGILVINVPGVTANAVADLTFGLMLCVARHINEADILTKQEKWERITGVELWEKTIGIIGVGNIGKAIARRAKGFNMKILGYDVKHDHSFANSINLEYVDLKSLLRTSNFIVLSISCNEKTKNLINSKTISLMSPDAYLINTARGELVETEALYKTLKEGKIAGAALDVYYEEPPIGNPLLSLPNIVTTCHIGGFSKEAMIKQSLITVQNVINFFKGIKIPEKNIANPDVLKIINNN